MKRFSLILTLALLVCVFASGAFASGAFASGADLSLQSVAQAQLPGEGILLSVEMDDGLAEYKFYVASTQETYEIKLDPLTGRVAQKDSDRWDDNGADTVVLNEEAARAVVLGEHPGAVIASAVIVQDDGLYEYKLTFTLDTLHGVYSIHPVSGVVLEREINYAAAQAPVTAPAENTSSGGASSGNTSSGGAPSGGTPSGNTSSGSAPSGNASSAAVTAEQAKALVLARITNGTITQFKNDTDDGRPVYEGEARDGTYEYDFEIDAATGRFLEWESERYAAAAKTAKPASSATAKPAASELIGTSKAKSIAVNKAGGGSVTSIRLTRDDGRQIYEGKVRTSSYEYEFEIDAATGKVLDWDADRLERDDDDDDDDRYDRDDDDDDDDDGDDDD